jgi:serine/threonine protein phosphatase PrpC
MRFKGIGQATDVGRVRDHNEDALLILPDLGLIAVADGMGGLADGQVAANTAVATLRAARDPLTRAVGAADDDPSSENRTQILLALEFLTSLAARTIQQSSRGQASGTTLVAAVIAGGHLLVCHVGDSRAYLLRDGRLRPITEDHTVAAARVRSGTMTQAEHDNSPLQHILYQAVGTSGEVDADLLDLHLAAGDRVMLCSDGLSGMLTESRMEAMLGDGDDLDGVCRQLVAAANEAGGRDNITVIVADVAEGPTAQDADRAAERLATATATSWLDTNDVRVLLSFLDEELLPAGQHTPADGALRILLDGDAVDASGNAADTFGALGLVGGPPEAFTVTTTARVAVLSPDAYKRLEPRRPLIAARLVRGALSSLAARVGKAP